MSGRIEISEADLREFMEAAEAIRDEAVRCVAFGNGFGQVDRTFNALDHHTEDRFERALDALKFDLVKERS